MSTTKVSEYLQIERIRANVHTLIREHWKWVKKLSDGSAASELFGAAEHAYPPCMPGDSPSTSPFVWNSG